MPVLKLSLVLCLDSYKQDFYPQDSPTGLTKLVGNAGQFLAGTVLGIMGPVAFLISTHSVH